MGQVMKNLVVMILAILGVSACSTYPSKFKCGEAQGLGCKMLADIDSQITSGEIDRVYASNKSKKCRGLFCKSSRFNNELPHLSRDKPIRVKMQDSDEYIWLEE